MKLIVMHKNAALDSQASSMPNHLLSKKFRAVSRVDRCGGANAGLSIVEGRARFLGVKLCRETLTGDKNTI